MSVDPMKVLLNIIVVPHPDGMHGGECILFIYSFIALKNIWQNMYQRWSELMSFILSLENTYSIVARFGKYQKHKDLGEGEIGWKPPGNTLSPASPEGLQVDSA